MTSNLTENSNSNYIDLSSFPNKIIPLNTTEECQEYIKNYELALEINQKISHLEKIIYFEKLKQSIDTNNSNELNKIKICDELILYHWKNVHKIDKKINNKNNKLKLLSNPNELSEIHSTVLDFDITI